MYRMTEEPIFLADGVVAEYAMAGVIAFRRPGPTSVWEPTTLPNEQLRAVAAEALDDVLLSVQAVVDDERVPVRAFEIVTNDRLVAESVSERMAALQLAGRTRVLGSE